jgi:hypothetical protein
MKISLLPVVAAAALAFSGCAVKFNSSHSSHNTTVSKSSLTPAASQEQMVFRYTNYNGKAALESDRVVLVFDGISRDEQRAFHFGGNAQAIQVSGTGTSAVDVSCRRNVAFLRFHSAYANGTNTLQFGKQVIRFADGGQLLIAGEQTVPLTNGQTRVHLNRKGQITQTVQPEAAPSHNAATAEPGKS